MPEILYRTGTWDENIWRSVVDNNEYGIVSLKSDDVVVDIGAHIGGFTYKALDCGAGLVIAIEPDTESANYWRHNLHTACKAENRSILITAACWRSDKKVKTVRYAAVGLNTGGGSTLGNDGVEVRAVSLDSVLRFAADLSDNGRIRLLKMDCEGAEWPILLTAHLLPVVDEVIGEYHEIDDLSEWEAAKVSDHTSYKASLLTSFFQMHNFNVQIAPMGKLGKFRAWR